MLCDLFYIIVYKKVIFLHNFNVSPKAKMLLFRKKVAKFSNFNDLSHDLQTIATGESCQLIVPISQTIKVTRKPFTKIFQSQSSESGRFLFYISLV